MSESKNVSAITDADFEKDVLKAEGPVLVDFWAAWCAPCRLVAPVIDEIADSYGSKIKVFKMDVDGNSGTAHKYGIRSIPTIMLFKNGVVVDQVIGANASMIKSMVEKNT
ncbi:MAG: thioredoxin [Proteobacteria bacterium]|nr:thioredoxin [Pseudomonadota bacterium]